MTSLNSMLRTITPYNMFSARAVHSTLDYLAKMNQAGIGIGRQTPLVRRHESFFYRVESSRVVSTFANLVELRTGRSETEVGLRTTAQRRPASSCMTRVVNCFSCGPVFEACLWVCCSLCDVFVASWHSSCKAATAAHGAKPTLSSLLPPRAAPLELAASQRRRLVQATAVWVACLCRRLNLAPVQWRAVAALIRLRRISASMT